MSLKIDFSATLLSPEEEKLAELILYIAEKSSDDEGFDATKLNKILHAADFLAFAIKGEAITGVDYFHLTQGPGARRFVPVREHLVEKDRLAIEERRRFGYAQFRPVALDEADLSNFEAREISIVDDVIRILWGKTAKQVSEGSHVNDISLGWPVNRGPRNDPLRGFCQIGGRAGGSLGLAIARSCPVTCPHCRSRATSRRLRRTELGYRRFQCRTCRRRFNERTGTRFNEIRFPSDVVMLAVLWRLRYKLSLRDVAEMLLERGLPGDTRDGPHVGSVLRTAALRAAPCEAAGSHRQLLVHRRDLRERSLGAGVTSTGR